MEEANGSRGDPNRPTFAGGASVRSQLLLLAQQYEQLEARAVAAERHVASLLGDSVLSETTTFKGCDATSETRDTNSGGSTRANTKRLDGLDESTLVCEFTDEDSAEVGGRGVEGPANGPAGTAVSQAPYKTVGRSHLDMARTAVCIPVAGPRGRSDSNLLDCSSYSRLVDTRPLGVATASCRLPCIEVFPNWFDPGAGVEECEVVSPYDTDEFGEVQRPDRFVLLPMSSARLLWDTVFIFCLIFELWVHPFTVVFLAHAGVPWQLEFVSYILTVFFIMDILINLSTGFIVKDRIVMKRREIVTNYMRFWFWVDLVATIPFDLMSWGAGLGHMGKVMRTFRLLRLLRAARLVTRMQQFRLVTKHLQVLNRFEAFQVPVQVLLFLAAFSHMHGCIWAAVQPDRWGSLDTAAAAFNAYLESLWWAFSEFTMARSAEETSNIDGAEGVAFWALQVVIVLERLLALAMACRWMFFQSLRSVDAARKRQQKSDLVRHMLCRGVSFRSQLQLLAYRDESAQMDVQRRLSSELVDGADIPRELRHALCAELWAGRLRALQLITVVASWCHSDFAAELSQHAQELVLPSRGVLFRAGHAADSAYGVAQGELRADRGLRFPQLPNFIQGMWVGESALVSSVLRRSSTCIAVVCTTLVALRGDSFHEVISRHHLMHRFQMFCAEVVWRGFCGRCGSLGDHFSDTCPQPSRSSTMILEARHAGVRTTPIHNELTLYLEEHDLGWLAAFAPKLNMRDLDDFVRLDRGKLSEVLSPGQQLSAQDEYALSAHSVEEFRARTRDKVHRMLFGDISRLHHFIFLSHYKLEGGTEAALMHTELQHAILADPGSPGHSFDEPVFLDSDNLESLEDLQRRVCSSHNLVLLLTKGVLLRPWVLVELITAKRNSVPLHLVTISKPGCIFSFPDDAFFARLRNRELLDAQAMELLDRCGYDLAEVEDTLRSTLSHIAVPYSPHQMTRIRHAEVEAILKQCRLKWAVS